jgi:hypothetical protein
MKYPFTRTATHTGARTIAQSHVMSFLSFRKTRTAANVIQVLKNISNADIDTLTLYGVPSEAVSLSSPVF